MALNTTALAAAMRLGDGVTAPVEPLAGILTRLLAVGVAQVELAAPSAPAAVKEEATIRMAAYLYDMPQAASGGSYAAAWRNSGGQALTSGYVVRRSVLIPTSIGGFAAGFGAGYDVVRDR